MADDWFNQVTSFLVRHDMLDAREEYDINDVMTALADNYEPAPRPIEALRKIEAAALGGYLTPDLCAEIVTAALASAEVEG